MSKRIASLLLVLLTVLSLAPCQLTASISVAYAESTEPLEIAYWHTWKGDWGNVIQGICDDYNASQTKHKVVPTIMASGSDADTKFLAAMAGGIAPDVFCRSDGYYGGWVAADGLEPLDPYLEKLAPDYEDWVYKSILDYTTYKGNIYSIPMSMDIYVMWYNQTLLENNGVDCANLPQDLDEFTELGMAQWKYDDRGNPEVVGLYPHNDNYVQAWLGAFGASIYDKDKGEYTVFDPGVVRMFEYVEKFAQEYKIDATKFSGFRAANDGGSDETSLYVRQKQAFWLDGMWVRDVVSEYAPEATYSAMPIPYPAEGGKPNASWISGNYNFVARTAKNKEGAVDFMLWLGGYNNEETTAELLTRGGWLPISAKVAACDTYKNWLAADASRAPHIAALESGNSFSVPVTPIMKFFDQSFKAAVERVMYGESAQDSLQQMDDELKAEMAKFANK